MTLEHKTSHKGQFFEIEIYTSSESWINNLSIDVCLLWCFPVAQMVEHGASNAKIMGSIPRESKSW